MIKINITSLVTVLAIYGCFQCERNSRIQDIKQCMKSDPAEICIKMHKGL